MHLTELPNFSNFDTSPCIIGCILESSVGYPNMLIVIVAYAYMALLCLAVWMSQQVEHIYSGIVTTLFGYEIGSSASLKLLLQRRHVGFILTESRIGTGFATAKIIQHLLCSLFWTHVVQPCEPRFLHRLGLHIVPLA